MQLPWLGSSLRRCLSGGAQKSGNSPEDGLATTLGVSPQFQFLNVIFSPVSLVLSTNKCLLYFNIQLCEHPSNTFLRVTKPLKLHMDFMSFIWGLSIACRSQAYKQECLFRTSVLPYEHCDLGTDGLCHFAYQLLSLDSNLGLTSGKLCI